MNIALPTVVQSHSCSAVLRQSPGDFRVFEELGFEPSGEGEHVFLHLEKRELNSIELQQRIAQLSGIPPRDIGLSGLKDRNAVTRQWFSVRMAGKTEPNWSDLESAGDVTLLHCHRHLRKLKRGSHRANRFELRLAQLQGDREGLLQRLERVKVEGVPNYFGEQRFGRNGATLVQAGQWLSSGGRKISRNKRSLYLSALRAFLFNTLLAQRVGASSWRQVLDGDVCVLQGSRSLFSCDKADAEIQQRAQRGDIHPGLPLWGRGAQMGSQERQVEQANILAGVAIPGRGDTSITGTEICRFLERMGLELAYRPARLLADDFCWQFCDDDSLQLDFALGTGGYATAVLAELLDYTDIKNSRGKSGSSEQG